MARSLYLHPDICCSAGVDHPITSLKYDFKGADYKRILLDVAKNKGMGLGGYYPAGYRDRPVRYDINGVRIEPKSLTTDNIDSLNPDDIPKISDGASYCVAVSGPFVHHLFKESKEVRRLPSHLISPERLFFELENITEARYVGNVHAHTTWQYQKAITNNF